jgi:hypothetical protein
MVLRLYCHTTYVLYGFIPVPVKGRVFTVMGMVMENWNHGIPVNNPSTAALKQAQNKLTKDKWKKQWANSPRGKCDHQIDKSSLSKQFINSISNPKLPRQEASIISQLRTAHVPLNSYLFRFKCIDSPRCPACGPLRSSRRNGHTLSLTMPRLCTQALGVGKSCRMQTRPENALRRPQINSRPQELYQSNA